LLVVCAYYLVNNNLINSPWRYTMNKKSYPAILILTLFAALSSCATGPSASPLDGTWDFTMSGPFGAVTATVTMATDGEALTGFFDLGGGRSWPIEDGVANGSDISFSIDRDGSPLVYNMSATIEGDSAAGTASAMGTEAPWTMTRGS
jgi:hypothetical protein